MVVCRQMGPGPDGAESTGEAVDHVGIDGTDGHLVVAESLRQPQPGVVVDDIAPSEEPLEDSSRVGCLHVESDRPFCALASREHGFHVPVHVAGQGLDLDHVGAELRENEGCDGAGEVGRQIEHPHVAQEPRRTVSQRFALFAGTSGRHHLGHRADDGEGPTVGVIPLEAQTDLAYMSVSQSVGRTPHRFTAKVVPREILQPPRPIAGYKLLGPPETPLGHGPGDQVGRVTGLTRRFIHVVQERLVGTLRSEPQLDVLTVGAPIREALRRPLLLPQEHRGRTRVFNAPDDHWEDRQHPVVKRSLDPTAHAGDLSLASGRPRCSWAECGR